MRRASQEFWLMVAIIVAAALLLFGLASLGAQEPSLLSTGRLQLTIVRGPEWEYGRELDVARFYVRAPKKTPITLEAVDGEAAGPVSKVYVDRAGRWVPVRVPRDWSCRPCQVRVTAPGAPILYPQCPGLRIETRDGARLPLERP